MLKTIVPRITAPLVLTLVLGLSARAEDPILRLDPLVVTVRGRATSLSATPGGVGVLEGDTLFRDQALSLSNSLALIPGVDKSSDSAWGSEISIRGLSRNRLVFLIDGARVNTATDINAQYGLVDPFDIERVEVLKGPISALYGSGSIGGVVNVITRKGEFTDRAEWQGALATTYQTNPEGPGVYGRLQYNSPDLWVYVSGSGRDRDSYEDADNRDVPNSQFDDRQGKLRLGYRWNPDHVTEFNYQYSYAHEVGLPGRGLALPVGPDVTYPDTRRDLLSVTHTYTPESEVLTETQVMAFYQVIERRTVIDNFPGGPMLAIHPEADHDTYGLKWQNTLELGAHTVVAGVDAWRWAYSGSRPKFLATGAIGVDSPLADSWQLSTGVFAEDDWELNDALSLSFGGRLDQLSTHSDAIYDWVIPPGPFAPTLKRGSEDSDDIGWNVHGGLTWRMAPGWSSTAVVASSYRAPDLMDRYKYLILGGGIELYGNPDLDPERSMFYEYGLHYSTERVRVSGALFLNQVDDLISERTTAPGRRDMVNISEAEIYGAELESHWLFARDWRAYATVAYANGEDVTADDYLPFLSPVNGIAGLAYEPEQGLQAGLELTWAAAQNKVAAGEATTDSWATLDARIGYRFTAGRTQQEITLAGTNLFDADYRHHLSTSRGFDLKEPGAAATLTWLVEF